MRVADRAMEMPAMPDAATGLPARRRADALAARVLVLCLVGVLAACAAPSSLLGRWSSPDAKAYRVGKVLVIVAVQDSTSRRMIEDAMVASLSARAVAAEPSYVALPAEGPSSENELARAMVATHADSVLLVSPGKVSSETVVAPATVVGPPPIGPAGFYPYYRGIWAPVYLPPTVYTLKTVSSETRLFEARSKALKWSGTAVTELSGAKLDDLARQFAALIVEALAADGLIRSDAAR